jgi:hypothetical protein
VCDPRQAAEQERLFPFAYYQNLRGRPPVDITAIVIDGRDGDVGRIIKAAGPVLEKEGAVIIRAMPSVMQHITPDVVQLLGEAALRVGKQQVTTGPDGPGRMMSGPIFQTYPRNDDGTLHYTKLPDGDDLAEAHQPHPEVDACRMQAYWQHVSLPKVKSTPQWGRVYRGVGEAPRSWGHLSRVPTSCSYTDSPVCPPFTHPTTHR